MAITLNFTPSAGTTSLMWINAQTDVVPKFDVFVPGAADGDTLVIRIANNSSFTSPVTYTTTISSAEYAAHEAPVGFAPVANGTWYADAQVNGGLRSVAQSYFINADTTGPVLSAPVGTGLTYSSATVGATTDEGNGRLYFVVTTSATQPSVDQIIAGQNHLGAVAPMSGNKVVTATGAQVFNLTGISDPGGTIYSHLVQKDLSDNPSNRVTSAGFTIPSATGTAFHPTSFVVGSATLSNSDRTILTATNACVARSLVAYSGKKNIAFTLNAASGSAAVLPILTNSTGVGDFPGFTDTVPNACIAWSGNGWVSRNGAVLFTGPTFTVGDTVGASVDHGTKVFWITRDGAAFYGAGGTLYTRASGPEAGVGGIDYTSTATNGPVYAGAGSTSGVGLNTQWTMLTAWPWAAVAGYTYLG